MLCKNEEKEIELGNLNNQNNGIIPENQQDPENIQPFLSTNESSKIKIESVKSKHFNEWLETLFCCSDCFPAYNKFQVSFFNL